MLLRVGPEERHGGDRLRHVDLVTPRADSFDYGPRWFDYAS
jgi:hypothetical protein